MQNQKIWVKPTVKVYSKNDVLGKAPAPSETEGDGGATTFNSKTGS